MFKGINVDDYLFQTANILCSYMQQNTTEKISLLVHDSVIKFLIDLSAFSKQTKTISMWKKMIYHIFKELFMICSIAKFMYIIIAIKILFDVK